MFICTFLGKPHSPSSSRETNTPGGPETSKSPATSKDTKEPTEEGKRNKTPPRADSSECTAKQLAAGSRGDISSNYGSHIVHTSHVQQQQDIYEIGSTHPERYPPYGPGRQGAPYPGQRHPLEHPHGIHREGDPYSERERPRVSSPPGSSASNSRGFQGRAGSPSPFALVPAGRFVIYNKVFRIM